MCDCIQKVNEQLPDGAGVKTLTSFSDGQSKAYIPVRRAKEDDTFISPTYCPFCGQPYEEDSNNTQ